MIPLGAAARALEAGDVLAALQGVALRDEPVALAIRGVAMARLGDLERARALLKAAGRGFASTDRLAQARCCLAEAEIRLAARDGAWPSQALDEARGIFLEHGDLANALHLRLLETRWLILQGRLDAAEAALVAPVAIRSPMLAALRSLLKAHVALRRVQPEEARRIAATAVAKLPPERFEELRAELERVQDLVAAPVARRRIDGELRAVTLDDLAALDRSGALVVDVARFEARQGALKVALASRPVLFALLKALADAWPGDVSRASLIADAFGGRQVDESHRARLRVEMGRLRRALGASCTAASTPGGYRLEPRAGTQVVLLEALVDTRHGALLALLSDGEAWTSGALAEAGAVSQRSVQRGLEALAASGLIRPEGAGRARRWRVEVPDPVTTSLLVSPIT